MATDLLADSINDEIAFSALFYTCFRKFSNLCRNFHFHLLVYHGAPSELVDVVLYNSYSAASPPLDAIEELSPNFGDGLAGQAAAVMVSPVRGDYRRCQAEILLPDFRDQLSSSSLVVSATQVPV